MQLEVLGGLLVVLVGVAVAASVQAGLVLAYVAAFHAVAAFAGSLVLELAEGNAVRPANHVERQAARRMNSVSSEVAVRAAGLDVKPVPGGGLSKDAGKPVNLPVGERQKLRHVELEFPVHLHEAEYAAADMAAEPGRHVVERLPVGLHRIVFGKQYRIAIIAGKSDSVYFLTIIF